MVIAKRYIHAIIGIGIFQMYLFLFIPALSVSTVIIYIFALVTVVAGLNYMGTVEFHRSRICIWGQLHSDFSKTNSLNPHPHGPFWSLTSRGLIAFFGS